MVRVKSILNGAGTQRSLQAGRRSIESDAPLLRIKSLGNRLALRRTACISALVVTPYIAASAKSKMTFSL